MSSARLPDGRRLRWIGAAKREQIFTHEALGTFNIAALRKDCERRAPFVAGYTYEFDDPERMREMLSQRDINQQRVREMTPEEGDLPIIMVMMDCGQVAVVDGAHRLSWRMWHGKKDYRAYVVQESALPRYRVRVQITQPDGSWRDVTAKEILTGTWNLHPDQLGIKRRA